MAIQNFRNIGLNSNAVFRTALFSDDLKENNNITYFISSFKLPNIELEGQEIRTHTGKITLPGEVALFNPCTISLIVDEKLEVYKKFFELLNKYNKVGTSAGCGRIADSWIEVFDSKNHYLFRIVFHNSKLDSIGEFTYSNGDNQILTLDIVLKFDYFTME